MAGPQLHTRSTTTLLFLSMTQLRFPSDRRLLRVRSWRKRPSGEELRDGCLISRLIYRDLDLTKW